MPSASDSVGIQGRVLPELRELKVQLQVDRWCLGEHLPTASLWIHNFLGGVQFSSQRRQKAAIHVVPSSDTSHQGCIIGSSMGYISLTVNHLLSLITGSLALRTRNMPPICHRQLCSHWQAGQPHTYIACGCAPFHLEHTRLRNVGANKTLAALLLLTHSTALLRLDQGFTTDVLSSSALLPHPP